MFVVAVLWTAFFVVNFNIAMMIPLLPFIQQDMGLSPTQAAWCSQPSRWWRLSAIWRSVP